MVVIMLINHFQMLAQYNTLANRKLYQACAQLSDQERQRTRQAFFKSIHGTLNHIMVGDRIWLTRFEGKQIPSTQLDAILYQDFDELWQARIREDERIENFASNLTEEFLGGTISYVNNAGKLCTDPADLLVAHFFNHQTHHRGQIHDIITQTKVMPPSLDMHRIIRP
jgi:uncharacterized damage-inducible protein DinB